MVLTKLQTAIYLELKKAEGKPLHGYVILKRIVERGLHWSHQQVYREANKMTSKGALNCVDNPQKGKPDRKMYSLKDLVNYEPNFKLLTNNFILAYPEPEFIQRRYDELKKRHSEVSKEISDMIESIEECNDSALILLSREREIIEIDINYFKDRLPEGVKVDE